MTANANIGKTHAQLPWLTATKSALESRERDEMWSREGVLERASDRVAAAVNDDSVDEAVPDPIVEALSYPAARIIVSIIDDARITTRYARGEARSARDNLAKEGLVTNVFDDLDVELGEATAEERFERTHAADWLSPADAKMNSNLRPEDWGGQTYPSIPVTEYVTISANMDEEWALARQDVSDGRVILDYEEDLDAFAEEAVYQRISERLPFDVPEEVATHFDGVVETTRNRLRDNVFTTEIDRVEPGLFPPVIDFFVEHFYNVSHMPRFTVAAFLINIGMTDDEIVEYLGVDGTRGEKETRDQVEQIRTGGDGGEPYTPPTYSTIESWGHDWEKDALEQRVEHPLHYYRIKLQQEN